MAQANESQGLKIAVAAFVSLTVILAVTAYFLYSAYDKADVQRLAAEGEAKKARDAQNIILNEKEALTKAVGTRATEFDAYVAEIKAEQKKVDDKIVAIGTKVEAMVAKAQAAGAQGPELQETKDKVKQLIQEYQAEVNKNYISSMNRLADIFENLALQTTALSTSFITTKRTLEQANQINETAMAAQTDAVKKTKEDLTSENENHGKQRADLLKKVDELQTESAKLATDKANLEAQNGKLKEDTDKKIALLGQQIRELKSQLEKDESILDVPDGVVEYVDYGTGQVRVNATRSMGARPRMAFAVFDRNAPGIPTERPKAKIELTWVGDAYSVARIDKTMSPTDPIRTGDLIYSPVWDPNKPMRLALIGKMDVNRDGRDDRSDLRRMIEASGGVVDYDLPPPGAGKERGKLTGREAWYVIDDETPFVEDYSPKVKEGSAEDKEFTKKQSEAIRECRVNGVRPMRLRRLLNYLGYDFNAPTRGAAESVDMRSLNEIGRGRRPVQAKPAAAAVEEKAAPEAEEKAPAKEEKPKKEATKEDKEEK